MAKKHMHPQQSGADFRQFIPRFRRFGGSPMTLAAGLPTLSSLAAY
jgi:predicted urease superfamily metal-dependent hydrolase